MAAASANAQAARAERPERASDGGRRVTQSGPLRAAPEAAVGIGGGGGGGGDGFVVAARCSERLVAVGPSPSLLTFPLPHRTAVSREPGRWPRGQQAPPPLRAGGARGVPGRPRPSTPKSRAPARTFCPDGGGGALRPRGQALWKLGGNRYQWGLGSG